MAFETFNLGQVIQTAEAIKGMRRQSTTDALREQYLGEQIQNMRADRQRQTNLDAMNFGKDRAAKEYARAGYILQSDDPKGLIETQYPDIQQMVTKAGQDWAMITPEQLKQTAKMIQAKAGAEAGIVPSSPTPLSAEGKLGADIRAGFVTPEQAAEANQPESVRKLRALQSDPSLLATEERLRQAGRTQVSVNTKQETEEAKAVGKALGQQYVKLQEASVAAEGKINRLNRLDTLLAGVATGKLTPKMTELASYAEALGIKLDPNLDAKQGAEALIGEMTLQARNPAGGAGMPGAMSDADREFLKTLNPSLAQTPGGRKLVIETQRKLAKRDQQVAKMARAFRAANGTLEGFAEELQQWSAENPLFESESAVAGAAGAADFIYVPGQGLQPSR